MTLCKHLLEVCRYLTMYQLIKESSYSKSQFYQWLKQGVRARKPRRCKPVSQEVISQAAMTYYLGATASIRPDNKMVESPVIEALAFTGGQGPKRFLLSDNGSQYISTQHGEFLNKLDIIQKRIPACIPEYNGSVECGIKEFKNVFYNVWAQLGKSRLEELADSKEEELLEVVQVVVTETIRRMNEEIPRPSLKGVTAADVFNGTAQKRREINQTYLQKEQESKEVIVPWDRNDWKFLKEQFFKGTISDIELMTKFCFFLKRPLRKLQKLGLEVLGN